MFANSVSILFRVGSRTGKSYLKSNGPGTRPIQWGRKMFNDDKLRQEFNRIFDLLDHVPSPTGRLPTKETGPALQQLPSRTDVGEEIRKAFGRDDWAKLVSVDYGELELRAAAAQIRGDRGED
jgi:hypothetical protein